MPIPNEPVAIQKLYTSRNNNANAETFVGEVQRLWYNPDTNCLYVSDGTTPGGIPLNACGNVNANITVKDEGVTLTNNVSSLDFVGAGVTATAVGRSVTITIPGATGTTALIVQDEGVNLTTTANTLNFTGSGVTASNVGNVVTVNIPAVIPSTITTYDEGNLLTANTASYNFVGNSITATAVGNAVTVTVSDAGSITNLYNGSFYADGQTTLNANINSNSTLPIDVISTAGFYPSGYINIGTEVIGYTGKTATTFTGISRGQAGSSGSTHNTGDRIGATQVTGANVVANVLIDNTAYSTGVTLDPTTGIITIAHAGRYNLQFSVQIACYDNAPADTVVWFAQNGNTIPASASYATTPSTHAGVPGSSIITVNIFLDCVANDTIQLRWTSIAGKTVIATVPSINSTIPTSPGVIFTVNRIY